MADLLPTFCEGLARTIQSFTLSHFRCKACFLQFLGGVAPIIHWQIGSARLKLFTFHFVSQIARGSSLETWLSTIPEGTCSRSFFGRLGSVYFFEKLALRSPWWTCPHHSLWYLPRAQSLEDLPVLLRWKTCFTRFLGRCVSHHSLKALLRACPWETWSLYVPLHSFRLLLLTVLKRIYFPLCSAQFRGRLDLAFWTN